MTRTPACRYRRIYFFHLAHIPLKTVPLGLKPKQPIFKGKCALGLSVNIVNSKDIVPAWKRKRLPDTRTLVSKKESE